MVSHATWRAPWATLALAVALFVSACGSTASPASSPAALASAKPSQPWEQVLAAANQEGAVTVYGGLSSGLREALAPFEKAYPGIKMTGTFGPANDIVARLM